MIRYTYETDPVFFEYKNHYAGFHTGAVVTNGLAQYLYQLINCVDSLYWEIGDPMITTMLGIDKVDYITGHSLGGAAATLYTQLQIPGGMIGTDTFLVTFGAPATFNRDC